MVPTPENIEKARQFLFIKWKERAKERGGEANDLSNACKFASLFAQKLFGGKIQGNWHHQFLITDDGQRIDLTDAIGVTDNDPYRHDKGFWGNPEHKLSMQSCMPRVERWVQEFMQKQEHNLSFREFLKFSEEGTGTNAIAGFSRPLFSQPVTRQSLGVWAAEDPFFKRKKKTLEISSK